MNDLPLNQFIEPLNGLGLPYFVTGSVAAMIYGEPRTTQDVDLVLFLPAAKAQELVATFSLDSFYCPPEEILLIEAKRATEGHFNLIHHKTGFKADVYLTGNDPLHTWAMKNRKMVEMGTMTIPFAPPEFVILKKLFYFKQGGSSKHVRDIKAMLEISGEDIDKVFVEKEVFRLGVGEEWETVSS